MCHGPPVPPLIADLKALIAHAYLRIAGWELVGEGVLPPRFVFIAAPHTSNWDFPHMVATAWALRVRIQWLGKHTLFGPATGWLFRAFGGIPVDRRAAHNMVESIGSQIAESDGMILAVPPEGTRGKTDYWKSGFYHIARRAGVPIGFGFLDYGKGQCGIGGFLEPTGDVHADMDRIRAFYGGMKGRRPALQGTPRLKEEDAAGAHKITGRG